MVDRAGCGRSLRGRPAAPTTIGARPCTLAPLPFQLRLLDPPALLDTAPGETLLEAAQRGGTPLQSSCRNGTCRTCMCRLVSGTVVYRVEWPGITTAEQDDGWVLPCVALPASDVVLGEPAQQAWWEA